MKTRESCANFDLRFRRTVYDPLTGQDVVLSNEDVDLIKNVMGSNYPDGSYNPYQPWVDWFTGEVMETPVTAQPEHKRSFLPSRVEAVKSKRTHVSNLDDKNPNFTSRSQLVGWCTPSRWAG